MKILFLRILSVLVTLAIVLVLFEYYLRSVESYVVRQEVSSKGFVEANPELLVDYTNQGRRLLPNAHVIIKNHALSKEDIKVDTNSLGFRYREIPKERAPDEYRVMVLGDSVTIVDYLPAEEGWTAVAERTLNTGGLPPRYSMINAGLGNFSLEDEVRIFQETRDAVNPNLVLLAFYLNDSRPAWGFAGEIGGRSWLRKHSLIAESIYRHFKLSDWMKDSGVNRFQWIAEQKKLDWSANRAAFLELARSARFDWGAAWDPASWEVVRGHLDTLQSSAAERGIEIGIAMFPVTFQVEAAFLENEPQQKMAQIAAERGIPFYDLLPALRAAPKEPLFYDQCHLNRPGNLLVGRKIAEFVEKIRGSESPKQL